MRDVAERRDCVTSRRHNAVLRFCIAAIVSVIGVAALSVIGVTAWWRATPASEGILIVVPSGFEGPFEIVLCRVRGADPQRVNGTFRFDIPPSGRLYVRDISAFSSYRRYAYERSDGTPCRVEHLGTLCGVEEVAPGKEWRGSTSHDGTSIMFRTIR
jgi:hypothetical protein